MRKFSLFFIFSLIFLFSSCLNDDESGAGGENQFTVVQTSTLGVKFVFVPSGGMITSEILDDYRDGDALWLASYNTSFNNPSSNGIVRADYINVDTVYPNRSQKTLSFQEADTSANIVDQIGLKDLRVLSSDPDGFAFLNRVLLAYSFDLEEGEMHDLEFIYDENKQVDGFGKPLGDDRVVLDVLVVKNDGVVINQANVRSLVLNASSLRARLTPSQYPNGPVIKQIDFRYSRYNPTTKGYETVFMSNPIFFFRYYKPQ